ncbi:MAG TPA: hypothetical protein VMV10_02205 [Pirellulales bacterium]|nr:hypothetical protein [Pirellulales bacterium]
MNKFGHFLEARVIKRYGEIDVAAASAIDVAVRWQKHVELAQRWLAIEYDRLSPAERLHFSKEAAKGAESRDKAIRLLRLERSQEAEIDALYAELRSGALDAAPVKQTSPEPQNGGQE